MVHDERVRRLRRAAGPAAWLLSTAVATAVAWWAVTAVGTRGDDPASVLDQAQVAAALATERAAATASPTATAPASPTASPSPAGTPSAPAGTAPPAPAPVVRTWTLDGGVVSASCTADVVTLVYATPAGGWRVDVKEGGPGPEIRVELERDGAETLVQAVCVDGVPQHTLLTDDSHGGDDGRED